MSRFDDTDDDTVKFAFATPRLAPQQPGQVRFDERGNSIYEWTDARLDQDGERAEKLRNKALAHAGLSLIDDEPATAAPVKRNGKGLRIGYNPYESGLLAGKAKPKRRSMRELSQWIEMKRRLDLPKK